MFVFKHETLAGVVLANADAGSLAHTFDTCNTKAPEMQKASITHARLIHMLHRQVDAGY